jgi:outer membrane protein OmpA-like peptidoglycan-associated protein
MKLKLLIFLFFTLSLLLITFVLKFHAKSLNDQRLEQIRLSKIQKVCMKSYPRQRKLFNSNCSLFLAQNKIDILLTEQPLHFFSNSYSLESNGTEEQNRENMKQTLKKVLAVVNHIDDDVILSIETHTDDIGTKQHNLKLSQQRADVLKNYFLERTELPHVVAIGYGESLPLSQSKEMNSSIRRVEINLKGFKNDKHYDGN